MLLVTFILSLLLIVGLIYWMVRMRYHRIKKNDIIFLFRINSVGSWIIFIYIYFILLKIKIRYYLSNSIFPRLIVLL